MPISSALNRVDAGTFAAVVLTASVAGHALVLAIRSVKRREGWGVTVTVHSICHVDPFAGVDQLNAPDCTPRVRHDNLGDTSVAGAGPTRPQINIYNSRMCR